MTDPKTSPEVRSEQQQRREESKAAEQAQARNATPQDIAQRTRMQRQGNHQHQQDGK